MISHIILIVHLSSWIVTIQERDTEGKSESAAQKWWKEMISPSLAVVG